MSEAILPEPLVPIWCRLIRAGEEPPPMPVPHSMLMSDHNSDWRDEAFTIARLRTMAWAWRLEPAASIPDDSRAWKYVASSGTRGWSAIEARLRSEWMACADGRLYHPWLGEMALVAWRRMHRQRRDELRTAEWAILRIQTFRRDGFVCQYCDTAASRLHCDHIIPVSRGGGNQPSNLITACEDCNLRKRALPVEAFLASDPERLARILVRLEAAGGVV